MSILVLGESMNSSKMDVVMTFLREQDHLIKELIHDVEKDTMNGDAMSHRIVQIEGNLKKLRSIIH